MKFNPKIPVYGDTSYRGDCPPETMEQVTFFNQLTDDLRQIAIHPKNEEKRKGKDFQRLKKDKALGMTPGASDIILPGGPAFVCELKRRDHTKSKWEDGQQEYLEECANRGAFVCVALGWEAAFEALKDWQSRING